MSNEHVLKTIEMVQGEISQLDQQMLDRKRMVNDLCRLVNLPPAYGDADLTSRAGRGTTRPDEYYGKALASVVRWVLEKRRAAGLGAATVQEIYEDMVAGGYHFQTKNDDNAKRSLYSSLGKNSAVFHRLPNGTHGLREWYPELREIKPKSNGNGDKPLHEELQEDAADPEAEVEVAVTPK